MHSVVQSRRLELTGLCRKYRVRRLALFGSAARGDFNPDLSDVDFIVEFEDPAKPGYADRYLDFASELEILLGRHVDLITARSIVNPVLEKAIERDRVELYAA